MSVLFEHIASANEAEIEKILKSVLERYAELYPDWELSVIPLQKGVGRNEEIDRFISILHSMKTLP